MMNDKMMPIDDNSHLWTWLSMLDMFGVFLLTVNTVLFMSKRVLKFPWCIKETSIYDCGVCSWVIKTWKSSFFLFLFFFVFYFWRCIYDLIIEKTQSTCLRIGTTVWSKPLIPWFRENQVRAPLPWVYYISHKYPKIWMWGVFALQWEYPNIMVIRQS